MKWISFALALLGGAVVGFYLGGGHNPTKPDSPTASGQGEATQSTVLRGEPERGAVAAASGRGEERAVPAALTEGPVDASWIDALEDLSDFEQVGAIHARLKTLKLAEFPELMEKFGNRRGGSLSWQARSMIAARWAELDPEGLKEYTDSQPRNMRWGLTSALYSNWAKHDPDAALADAQNLSHHERRNAIGAIAASLADESPQRALRVLADAMGTDPSAHWNYRNLFASWARKDPAAALAAAHKLEDPAARASALVGSMQDLIGKDPRAAIDWLDEQEPNSVISQVRQQLLNEIMQEDLGAVLEYVENQPDALKVREILQNIHFSNLGRQQDYETLEGLVDWLGEVATGRTYSRKVDDIMRAMTNADPERARDYVLELPPGEARTQSVGAVAQALVQRGDPSEAMAFVEGLEFEDEKRRALQQLSWQLSRNFTEQAKKIMIESDDPVVQQTLANSLGQQLMQSDREGTLEWAGMIKDEQARGNVTRSVLSQWVIADPEAVFSYIGNMEEEADKANYYQTTIQNFVNEDPARGVEWLDRLDEQELLGNYSHSAYQQVANSYIRFDPMAASEWIATLEGGKNRDGAVSSLVNQIHRTDPEAAFEWAATVDGNNTRQHSLERSVREWGKVDPDAAFEAVKDADIETSEKERLFKMIPDD